MLESKEYMSKQENYLTGEVKNRYVNYKTLKVGKYIIYGY